jgi:hypothetical protein
VNENSRVDVHQHMLPTAWVQALGRVDPCLHATRPVTSA